MSEKRDLFEIPQGMKDDVSDAAKLLRGFVSHVDRRMREEHTSGLFDEVEEESAEGMISEAAEALQQREAAFAIPEVSESASYLKGTKIPTAKEDASERDIFGAAQRAFKEQNGTVPPLNKAEKPVTADIPLYEPEDLTQTIPDMPPPAFPPREEPSALRLQREQAPTLKNEAFSEFETSPNVPAFRPPADFTEPVDPLSTGAEIAPSSQPNNYNSPSPDAGRKRKSPELSTHPSLPTVKDVSELTGSKLDTVPPKKPSALDDEIVGLGMMLDSAITSLSQDLLPSVPSQSSSKEALKTASSASASSPSRPALPDIQAFGTLEVPSVNEAAKDDDDEENAYSVTPRLADPQDQTALEAFHKASASGELERFEGDVPPHLVSSGTTEFEVPISSSKQKVSSFSDLDAISKNLVSDLLELDLKNSLEEQVRSLTQDDLPSFSLPSGKAASEDKADNTKLTDHTLDARPFADSPEAKSFLTAPQNREDEHAATYASLPVLPAPAQDVDEGVLLREQSLDETPFGMGNEPAGSSQPTRSMHPFQQSATPSAKVEMAAISLNDADSFAQEKAGAADTIAQMDVLHIASTAAKDAAASTKKPSSSTRPLKPFSMAPPSSAVEEPPSSEKKADISISAPASASSFTLSSEKAVEEPAPPPPSQEISVKVEVSERKQSVTESGVFASFSIGLDKHADVPLKPSPRTEKAASPAAAKPASAVTSQPIKVESALKTDAKPSAKSHAPVSAPHKGSDAVDFDPMSENFFSSPANDLASAHLSPEEDEFHRLVAEQKAEADRNRKILLFGGIGVILVAALMLLAIGSLQQPPKPKPDELTPEPIISRKTPPAKRTETPPTPRPSERPMLARAEGQDAGASSPLPDARQPDASPQAGSTQGRETPVRRDEPEPVRRDEPEPVRRDEPEPVRRDEPEPVRRDEPKPIRRDEPKPIRRPILRPVKRRAAPRNPQLAKKHHAEGMRLMFSGKLPAARQKMQSAIKADPKMADAYRVLGLIYLNLKQTKQAKRSFNQFLRLSPNAPTAPQIRAITKTL